MENIEAIHYLEKVDYRSKIPYISRENSIRFIDSLYGKNALSVEVSKTDETDDYFIVEISIRYEKSNGRQIINQALKSNPDRITEITIGGARVPYRILRVGWKTAKELNINYHDDF